MWQRGRANQPASSARSNDRLEKSVARKSKVAQRFQADLGGPVPCAKIFRFQFDPNHRFDDAVPFRQEGRIARRHERGTGCGGRENAGAPSRSQARGKPVSDRAGAEDERRFWRTAKPCGPDTRCWCQVCGGQRPNRVRRNLNPQATVTRRIRRRGEHGISRQTIAQGMPDCSVCTCSSRVRFFAHVAHETAGADRTRHSLHPPCSRVIPMQNPDAMRRGNVKLHPIVIACPILLYGIINLPGAV